MTVTVTEKIKPEFDSQEFKTRDATSYDALTAEFDLFTERLTSGLAAHMVALAAIKPSDRVLDVGTGTGVVALQAAARTGAGGRVDGIDLSAGMLAAARAKAEKLGLADRVSFTAMDAEKLEFADETFDVVVSLYALLHFPDPLAALKEIRRVLKPGGRVVVAGGSSPSLLSAAGLRHAVKILPDLLRRKQGRQLVAPAFLDALVAEHLPETDGQEESHLASRSHNRTGGVAALVELAGLKVLKTDWRGGQAVMETPEEFWEIQRTFSSISRKRLNDAAPDEVAAVRARFLEQCRAVQSRGGNLVYPYGAFFVTAEKK